MKNLVFEKSANETIQNEAKEQKGGFPLMLLGKLGAILLGNLLTRKGVKTTTPGRGVIRAGEGAISMSQKRCTIRVGQNS